MEAQKAYHATWRESVRLYKMASVEKENRNWKGFTVDPTETDKMMKEGGYPVLNQNSPHYFDPIKEWTTLEEFGSNIASPSHSTSRSESPIASYSTPPDNTLAHLSPNLVPRFIHNEDCPRKVLDLEKHIFNEEPWPTCTCEGFTPVDLESKLHHEKPPTRPNSSTDIENTSLGDAIDQGGEYISLSNGGTEEPLTVVTYRGKTIKIGNEGVTSDEEDENSMDELD